MATIQGIYIALFGRPADPAGLEFFNGVTNNGADLTAIGDLASQDEYQSRFDGLSNEEIVNSIYQSLFGRDGEQAGIDFFVAGLEDGTFNINNIAIAILDGAQGDDLATVNAKIAAADIFTANLDQQVEVDAYAGADAAQIGRNFINGVDKDDEGTEAEADAAILLLLGEEGQEPGGSDGDGAGNPGGIVSEITLHQGLTLANLPSQYILIVGATAEDLGDISVADYGKIAGVIAGADNGADYAALGYSFAIVDSFANIEADSAFLSDGGLGGYSITDATLDLKLDTDGATLLRGADNFDSSVHDYDIEDAFADFAGLDAAVYNDADYVTVNGTSGDDVITGLAARNGLTVNGGAGADSITSPTGGFLGEDDHIFDGGAGIDTISLAANAGDDDIVLATSSADRDTINNFETGFDDLQVTGLSANVGEEILGSTEFRVVNGQLSSGFNGEFFLNVNLGNTSSNAIIEFNFNVSGDASLSTALDGNQLLDGITSNSTPAAIDVSDGWSGYLIAYDNDVTANAYVYYASDTNDSGFLGTSEIQLVAVVQNVSVGALSADNFIV